MRRNAISGTIARKAGALAFAGALLSAVALGTTSAHAQMAHIHGRQPVMLSPDSACAWLDTSQPTDCLTTLFDSVIPVSLQVVPVASYVNNTNHADQRCVEAVGPAVSVSPSNVSADPSVG